MMPYGSSTSGQEMERKKIFLGKKYHHEIHGEGAKKFHRLAMD